MDWKRPWVGRRPLSGLKRALPAWALAVVLVCLIAAVARYTVEMSSPFGGFSFKPALNGTQVDH